MAKSFSLNNTSVAPEVPIFFRDIKEHPNEDTPRLIFADWLEEHGDAATAARGEFLRLRVLRHHLSTDDPSYDVLKRREGELFTTYRWRWLGPLADQARYWEFERGMTQVWAQAEKVLTAEVTDWARTEAAFWIDALTLTDMTPRHLTQLAASPLLAHLNVLDLSDNRLRRLRPLFETPAVACLTRLVLSRNRLTGEEIAALTGSPHLPRLAELDLEHNRLDDEAAARLASAEWRPNLHVLRLRHNRFSAVGREVLRQVFAERVQF
jgi:uncharacterized protein (TIGR02996 family)